MYLTHISKNGERWDNLAYEYYGDPLLIAPILNANPHISFCEALSAGITVLIPVLEKKATQGNLPPWLKE